jgi:hypothetical protein
LRGAIDDGALDAHGAGAAVEHQQVVAEFCMHMRRRGGADAAEAVGRRRRQPALPAFENRQHGLGDGMGGAAQADGVLPPAQASATPGLRGRIKVSGPGQKAAASLRAVSGTSDAQCPRSAARWICTITGWSAGRSLAA